MRTSFPLLLDGSFFKAMGLGTNLLTTIDRLLVSFVNICESALVDEAEIRCFVAADDIEEAVLKEGFVVVEAMEVMIEATSSTSSLQRTIGDVAGG